MNIHMMRKQDNKLIQQMLLRLLKGQGTNLLQHVLRIILCKTIDIVEV
jgi:hypothetical protein